jgi:hypothetical protein
MCSIDFEINLEVLKMDKKVRGSFQMSESTKKAVIDAAKIEGRTFNNMLERLVKRAIDNKLVGA